MSRSRRLLAVAVALAAVALAPSTAGAYGDVKGPPCADMTPSIDPRDPDATSAAGEGYTSDGILVVQQQLSKVACDSMTYTLHVMDAAGTTPVATAAGVAAIDSRTGYPVVQFSVDLSAQGPPTTVCFFMTSEKGGKTLDRAPDTSCSSITIDSPGAPRKYG